VRAPLVGARTRALALPALRLPLRADLAVGLVAGAVVVFLAAVPLAMLLFSSVRATADALPFEATSFTLDNYVRVLSSSLTYRLLLNTLWYAVGSLAVGLSLGVAFSYLLERTNIPARDVLLTLVIANLAVPGLVDGMAWVMLANPNNGIINVALRAAFGFEEGPFDIYGVPGMILVTGTSLVPSIYILISGLFARMDPSLEEAAAMSGAGLIATLRRVTLPVLLPGLIAAAIYYFVVVTETFEIPALLGMSQRIFVFSTLIYQIVHPSGGLPDFGLASGYATVQLVASAGLMYFYARATREASRFSVIKGRDFRPRLIDLGRWKYVALIALVFFFFVRTVLPFLALVWTSTQQFLVTPSMEGLARASFANYAKIPSFPGAMTALANTALIGVTTVVATLVLSAVVAWMAIRSPYRWSWLPDRLSFLVVATPSIVLGLSLMFVYLWIPLPIYGTIAIVAIALVTRYLPFSVRLFSAALIQVHRELEESARVSGAGWLRTMSRVSIPLVLPTVWRGAMWILAHSIREATLSVMLLSTSNVTLGALLWLAWQHYGDVGTAAALATCIVIASGALTYVLVRSGTFSGRGQRALASTRN
jgi:iron(III) transport system permease protein